jgi:putative hydrolase of the HAD superfamily
VRNICWDKLELVIFDVDGTLYDQSKLRKKMFLAFIGYYALRPWKFNELLILHHFRKEREKKAGYAINDLQNEQYKWCAEKAGVAIEKVKRVVDRWIFDFPNQFLAEAMYPGVSNFFQDLENRKILKAVYSDYDAEKKLERMNINVALSVSSTDKDINAMKPLPNGVNYILSKLNIADKNNCLFIGDRQELDGECAGLAGIPFLLIDKASAKINLYELLSKNIIK